MSGLHSLKKTAYYGLGIVLACTVAISNEALAQVGPPPPHVMPAQESKVGKAIEKLLKKKKEDKEGTTAESKPQAQPNPEDELTDEEKAALKAKQKDMVPGVIAIPQREPILAQPPLTTVKIEATQIDSEHPPVLDHPKLDDPTNPLGLVDAQNRLKKFGVLVDAQRFAEAKTGLLQLRQWLVDVTEAHIGLYKTLNQIPSARAQAELEKTLALEFAQLRDRAMVDMAKIYIADKDYTRAMKELVDVVKSQPKSKIGLRSYELLQEIGFTEKLQLAQ